MSAKPESGPLPLINARAVQALTSLPPSTQRQYVAQGLFPAPVQLGPRRHAWRTEDVAGWINSRPTVVKGEAS